MTQNSQGEVEATVEYLKDSIAKNRKAIFWILIAVFFSWLMMRVKEVSALLLLSYAISLLINPVVTRLERRRIPRGLSVAAMIFSLVIFFVLILVLAVPPIIREYNVLVDLLPDYIKTASTKLSTFLHSDLGMKSLAWIEDSAGRLPDLQSFVGVEHLKRLAAAAGKTVLSGYSITLTLLNLFLLPFFVYYIAVDLSAFHQFFGSFLPAPTRKKVARVGSEILAHVYMFFKGQFTVAFILAALYSLGLSLAGLSSGVVVGTLAGLLSVIPYLGVAVGVILSVIITFVTDASIWQFAKIAIVFGIVQGIEGAFLTPRIVGEKLGIHPLGVMLALIVGGQLLGLLGIIIAIPAAAAFRVLVRNALTELEEPCA